MALHNYDPNKVVATWAIGGGAGTIDLLQGAAPGTFVTVSTPTLWAYRAGRNGAGVRVKNLDRSGQVSVTLTAESPLNAVLSAAVLVDDASEVYVGTILVRDLNGSTLFTCTGAFLQGMPQLEFGTEAGNRTWTWLVNEIVPFVGGQNAV